MNWLKQRREELGLSQEELSARLELAGFNVTRATISHWEVGKYAIPVDNVNARRAIAKALDLTLPDLIELAGYELEDEDRSRGENARRAAMIVDKLPLDAQRAAVDQLRALERLFARSGN